MDSCLARTIQVSTLTRATMPTANFTSSRTTWPPLTRSWRKRGRSPIKPSWVRRIFWIKQFVKRHRETSADFATRVNGRMSSSFMSRQFGQARTTHVFQSTWYHPVVVRTLCPTCELSANANSERLCPLLLQRCTKCRMGANPAPNSDARMNRARRLPLR